MTLLLIGAIIGAVLGLTGAGGSVLAVPLLMIFLKLDPATATGLALGVVAVSSTWGAIHRILQKKILWIPVILFGISGMVFAPIGRWLAAQVDPRLLTISFALMSTIIAGRMLWQSFQKPEQASLVRASTDGTAESGSMQCEFGDNNRFDWRLRCTSGLLGGGVATGLLSGFFGVGGGFLIVPFLNQLNSVSMSQAVATSLVIIAGISTSGFVMGIVTQPVELAQLFWLCAGGIVGMIVGSLVAKRIAGVVLQRIFALTIIGMAVLLLVQRT